MQLIDESYAGPERRRHHVYVTRNTEYHFRDKVCVAVRDRKTSKWLVSHLAVSRRLTGGIRFHTNGGAVPSFDAPQVGEALYFGDDGRELLTSLLCGVERPERHIVQSYPSA